MVSPVSFPDGLGILGPILSRIGSIRGPAFFAATFVVAVSVENAVFQLAHYANIITRAPNRCVHYM